jgi:type VI secretion system protein VasJ
MSDEIINWQRIGSSPIRPDAPTGASVRDDPAFEKLAAEIGKLEALSGNTSVNWKTVTSLSMLILKEKSKDLLVAAYLCMGLLEEQGYNGLLDGLTSLHAMIESFWPTLYPEAKRKQGRINALIWLSEKGATRLPKGESAAITAVIEKIALIDKLLSEKIGEPFLGQLRRAAEESLQNSAEPEAPASAEPSLPSPASEGGGGNASESASSAKPISSVADAEHVLREASHQIQKAAALIQDADHTHPWPYRAVRALIWLKIETLPAHNNENETMISPPRPDMAEHFEALVSQGAWKALLSKVESQFLESPFWLDLHYFSDLALSHLGSSTQSGRQAVMGELTTLLRRLPKLTELKFSDETPFASDETKAWIEKELDAAIAGGGAAAEQKPQGGAQLDDPTANVSKKLFEMFRQDQIKEALAFFQEEIAACQSERKQFLLRALLARACLDAGIKDARVLSVALSQLDILDRESVVLSSWEPALYIDFLQTFWHLLNLAFKETKQPDFSERMEVVYRRLARIDPVCAYQLEKVKKTRWGR